jgi:hypothetical protein
MADEATEFWNAFEKETGEKVEARSIGEWLKGDGPGIWGLVIITDKSFRFKHMPSDNWLLSLFKKTSKSSADHEKPVDIVIPRDELVAEVAAKRGLFARLMGPAFPHFSVKRAGEDKEYVFSADPASGLLAVLAAIAAAKS